jgi:hypothetical protein
MEGIQGEFQIGMEEWAWTLWQAPWEMTGKEERMPFHSHEGAEWGGGERKEPERIYLPWSCCTHIEVEEVRSFHPSLVMRARLTSSIFLKPRPPKALGEHREFQDLRERFLDFLGGKPRQKFLKHWSNFLQKVLGSKKVLIT